MRAQRGVDGIGARTGNHAHAQMGGLQLRNGWAHTGHEREGRSLQIGLGAFVFQTGQYLGCFAHPKALDKVTCIGVGRHTGIKVFVLRQRQRKAVGRQHLVPQGEVLALGIHQSTVMVKKNSVKAD